MIMWIVTLFIIFLLIYMFITYLYFVKIENNIKDEFAKLDISFKKRWDIIPLLVDIVRKYAIYELNTLENILKVRSQDYDKLIVTDKIKTNAWLDKELNGLFSLENKYLDMKNDEGFKNIKNEYISLQKEIENLKYYYNSSIKKYNLTISKMPNKLFAKIFVFKEKSCI